MNPKKNSEKRTNASVGSGRLVRLLCEKCGWYGTELEVAGKQYRDGDVEQWCPKCGASDDYLTECDCQDPEHGFVSMECPVHNWNPSAPNVANEPRSQIVVRLRRSFWHDVRGAYQRTSLRYLRRHTKGFNVFDDDCSMVGAEDVIPKIINLTECKDGIYRLVLCNAHTDWETGCVEDWDYLLIPFSPNLGKL